ncbi:hypothetical protein BZG36_02304 [Bifiguratus adelaidae]|uniref:Aminotransferase class I/classII large domain-containing protein n=1 Tax=Bifiguratus adelaidae TaxID=1938954 RepID=A0A261Y3Q2_9FUNG|nr:hypothetical protein BZG36_02304 [Bifiguratus adelaidae]
MSKAFSLAGLRLGWIISNRSVIEECIRHRDYNTISCGLMDDTLATHALLHVDPLMKRNRQLVRDNLVILDAWIERNKNKVSYVKPRAGTMALLRIHALSTDPLSGASDAFCIDLFKQTGVFVAPGRCFDFEGWIRVGYACETSMLVAGLEKLQDYIDRLHESMATVA